MLLVHQSYEGVNNPILQNQITQTLDWEAIVSAVQKGAEQGAYNGSAQGSQNGIAELSNNREIRQNAVFLIKN